MVDAEKYEEVCARRAELDAEDKVYRTILEFASKRAEECFQWRLFMEMQAWRNVVKEMNVKITRLCDEYDKVTGEISQADKWRP